MLPGNNSSSASINDLNRLGSFMGAMTQSNNDHETAALLEQRVAELALRLAR